MNQNTPHVSGADIVFDNNAPTIHLKPILSSIIDHFKNKPNQGFIEHNSNFNLLKINTHLPMLSVVTTDNFKQFGLGQDANNYIINALNQLPPKRTVSKLGGAIYDNGEQFYTQVKEIYKLVMLELGHVSDEDLCKLVIPVGERIADTAHGFSYTLDAFKNDREVGQVTQADLNKVYNPPSATIQNIESKTAEEIANERNFNKSLLVARIFHIAENIQAESWLNDLIDAVKEHLTFTKLVSDNKVSSILEGLAFQKSEPQSQLNNFLEFLDDVAMSRIRLNVAIELMNAVAQHSKKQQSFLKIYVENIKQCYEIFNNEDSDDFIIDASGDYDLDGVVDIKQHFENSYPYYKLPVFLSLSAQMFENIEEDNGAFNSVRDIAYRFKINGSNPNDNNVSAFESRLNRLADKLKLNKDTQGNFEVIENDKLVYYRYDIGELFLLYFAIPNGETVEQKIAKVKARYADKNMSSQAYFAEILEILKSHIKTMIDVGQEVVNVLQSKDNIHIINSAQKQIRNYVISIEPTIIDEENIKNFADAKTAKFLRTAKNETAEWLKHIRIKKPKGELEENFALTDFLVNMQINESSLQKSGVPRTTQYPRNLNGFTLPVLVLPVSKQGVDFIYDFAPQRLPFGWAKQEHTPLTPVKNIAITYWDRIISNKKKGDLSLEERIAQDNRFVFSVLMYSILTYITLSVIVNRLKRINPNNSFDMSITRLHSIAYQNAKLGFKGGDFESEAFEGFENADNMIYAIVKALQANIGRDVATSVQGWNTLKSLPPSLYDYKSILRAETFRARIMLQSLVASKPMNFAFGGSAQKIAIVAYSIRPCDLFIDANYDKQTVKDTHLVLSKTYIINRLNDTTGVLEHKKTLTFLRDSSQTINSPILKEIDDLYKDGFTDILLISNSYAQRKVGRSASRHATDTSNGFLAKLQSSFPQANLYNIQKTDVAATRLVDTKETNTTSAYVIANLGGHTSMKRVFSNFRELLPIFTLATFKFVGNTPSKNNDGRKQGYEPPSRLQSGLSTYFYDSSTFENVDAEKLEKMRSILRANDDGFHESVVDSLQALHFFESEKIGNNNQSLNAVLNPLGYLNPTALNKIGEIDIFSSRRAKSGTINLSLTAALTHINNVMHGLGQKPKTTEKPTTDQVDTSQELTPTTISGE